MSEAAPHLPAADDGFVFDPGLGFLTWHTGEHHVSLVSKGGHAQAALARIARRAELRDRAVRTLLHQGRVELL